jgi:hypothetical protein
MHRVKSPWGDLEGSAADIVAAYNRLVRDRGCGHAAITVARLRRLLRGALVGQVNGSILLWRAAP